MAKRTKFQHKSAALRPGPRPASGAARPAATPATARPAVRPPSIADEPLPVDLPDDAPMRGSASTLTEDEEQRAAAFEAQLRAQEKAALTEELRRKARAQEAADAGHRAGDINAPLAVRMAHEYAYVARDVKRIALTAGLMVAILAVLEILVNVMGVITL